jgi:uncharacterized lipoprotein YmbA
MRLLLITVISLLVACAGQPPEHSSYLLRSDKNTDSRQLNFEGDAFLGRITLARYIEQDGLVLLNANGTIHQARYHEWAEPLSISLREFFGAEISSGLGHDIAIQGPAESGVRIDIYIDQLHGNSAGEAVLVAGWSIGEVTYRFSEASVLEADGYAALVNAEKVLLKKLASAIAASLVDKTSG